MTRTTLNGKDILVVEVPEDALRPNIHDGILRWTSFKWDKSTQVENDKFLIPPIDGQWEIVLDTAEEKISDDPFITHIQ